MNENIMICSLVGSFGIISLVLTVLVIRVSWHMELSRKANHELVRDVVRGNERLIDKLLGDLVVLRQHSLEREPEKSVKDERVPIPVGVQDEGLEEERFPEQYSMIGAPQ